MEDSASFDRLAEQLADRIYEVPTSMTEYATRRRTHLDLGEMTKLDATEEFVRLRIRQALGYDHVWLQEREERLKAKIQPPRRASTPRRRR